MPKIVITLILMCIIFPTVVFANANSNVIPCFTDLTWGESSNSVLQKYRLSKIPAYSGIRNASMYNIQLDTPYIYDIRVLPTAYASFINDKLYSITVTYSLYGSDTDYDRFKQKLVAEFGEPDTVDTSTAYYEVSSWNKEIFYVVLTKSNITFSNCELSKQFKEELDISKGKNITDWSSYVH